MSFQKLIQDQKDMEKQINARVEDSFSDDVENVKPEPWKDVPADPDDLVSMNLRQSEFNNSDILEIDEKLNAIGEGLDMIKASLDGIIPPEEETYRFNKLIINGKLRVQQESSFVNVETDVLNEAHVERLFSELVRYVI